MSRKPRFKLAVLFAAVSAVALGGLVSSGLGPSRVEASSHREAPLISGLPQYDTTDVYAFVSPDKPDTTTLIASWLPFEDPAGGPNFYKFATDARYDVNIDNDGDSIGDITYEWTFKDSYQNRKTFLYNTGPVNSLTDPNLNFRQTYDLVLIEWDKGKRTTLLDDAPVAPSNVGQASMPNYETLFNQATLTKGKLKSYAGQSDDAFFLDLRVFDLLYGGNLSEVGNDTLKGYNVQSVALQVPTKNLTSGGDPVIGVCSTTAKRDSDDNYQWVSRLCNPLVNEVVIPLKDKDKFNRTRPRDDGQFLKYVTNPELPTLIEAIYKIKAPKTPRNDLVQVFLTGVPGLNQPKNVKPSEMLRLNTSIPPTAQPKRLGVLDGDKAGFPNGRRLTDDVVDIELQAVEGELVGSPNDLGDAVNANDVPFRNTFPYLALPASGSAVRGSLGQSNGKQNQPGNQQGQQGQQNQGQDQGQQDQGQNNDQGQPNDQGQQGDDQQAPNQLEGGDNNGAPGGGGSQQGWWTVAMTKMNSPVGWIGGGALILGGAALVLVTLWIRRNRNRDRFFKTT
ncbi:DUF4331 domain-containing protein [Flindersiella endophytica]